MHITVTYKHHRQPTVYGPAPDRHPPTAPGPGEIAVTVPLHPAETTHLDQWPRSIHTSRRVAAAIAHANPANDATGPTVLLLTNPTTGMLTAIGPFDTTTEATTWLHETGQLGGDISAAAFPLRTPPIHPPQAVPNRHGNRGDTSPQRQAEPDTAPPATQNVDHLVTRDRQQLAAEPERARSPLGTPIDRTSEGGR